LFKVRASFLFRAIFRFCLHALVFVFDSWLGLRASLGRASLSFLVFFLRTLKLTRPAWACIPFPLSFQPSRSKSERNVSSCFLSVCLKRKILAPPFCQGNWLGAFFPLFAVYGTSYIFCLPLPPTYREEALFSAIWYQYGSLFTYWEGPFPLVSLFFFCLVPAEQVFCLLYDPILSGTLQHFVFSTKVVHLPLPQAMWPCAFPDLRGGHSIMPVHLKEEDLDGPSLPPLTWFCFCS